jgi:CRP-like cAMP-binding protein
VWCCLPGAGVLIAEYPPPPPATTSRAWRRKYIQEAAEGEICQREVFLNSVPLLAKLTREDKMKLVDAFGEEVFAAGSTIIREGDPGDKFYIVKR